jgi:AcrR family transcriptional regulator
MPAISRKIRARRGVSRADQKAGTRLRVLKAALDVFSEEGYERATTAQIARRAGVSHGMVFVVAPTKESLAVAAFEDSIRAVVSAAFLRAPAKLNKRLEFVFSRLFDYYSAIPPLSRALIKHLTFLPESPAKKQYVGLIGEFLKALEAMFTLPEMKSQLHADVSPVDAAHICFSVYLFSLLLLLNDIYPTRQAHAAAFRRRLNATLRGILVRE